MKHYLILKHFIESVRGYIFIILTATIFSLFSAQKVFSDEDVFVVDSINVEGDIKINFSRDDFIDKAFFESFEVLMYKILLSNDYKNIGRTELKEIKNLINSFQITEEIYRKNKYSAKFKINYSDTKVKKFLAEKNISFSQPKNISAVFYPIIFIDDKIQDFNANYFYKNWLEINIENELINFILPIEDIDDFNQMKEVKNRIEELNIIDIIEKYNTKNYVFALLQYESKNLNVYIKTNFNDNQISKNFSYKINDIKNEIKLETILKDMKMQITDIWKADNTINVSFPLSIRIKLKNSNLKNLNKLKKTLYKISIIDSYFLEEFSINQAFFKVYYYGNPKKLTQELSKFGYQLKNDQINWVIYSE